jgi:hypothetical protein
VKYKTSKIYPTTKKSWQARHIHPPRWILETLCELHNGDVVILYGWPNFEKKSCVFYFDLLHVLV